MDKLCCLWWHWGGGGRAGIGASPGAPDTGCRGPEGGHWAFLGVPGHAGGAGEAWGSSGVGTERLRSSPGGANIPWRGPWTHRGVQEPGGGPGDAWGAGGGCPWTQAGLQQGCWGPWGVQRGARGGHPWPCWGCRGGPWPPRGHTPAPAHLQPLLFGHLPLVLLVRLVPDEDFLDAVWCVLGRRGWCEDTPPPPRPRGGGRDPPQTSPHPRPHPRRSPTSRCAGRSARCRCRTPGRCPAGEGGAYTPIDTRTHPLVPQFPLSCAPGWDPPRPVPVPAGNTAW